MEVEIYLPVQPRKKGGKTYWFRRVMDLEFVPPAGAYFNVYNSDAGGIGDLVRWCLRIRRVYIHRYGRVIIELQTLRFQAPLKLDAVRRMLKDPTPNNPGQPKAVWERYPRHDYWPKRR